MKSKNQAGFSLIELLLVVVIIGIVAAIAVPNFMRASVAAENGSAYSLMRSLISTETTFYSVRGRYARLDELAPVTGNSPLGTHVGSYLYRGKFTYEMMPLVPTDDELKSGFTVAGVRNVGGALRYEATQSGKILQVVPAGQTPE